MHSEIMFIIISTAKLLKLSNTKMAWCCRRNKKKLSKVCLIAKRNKL